MTSLMWQGPISSQSLVSFTQPADGSSLLHALLYAYNQNYRLERQHNVPISRQAQVTKLRQELANLLASPVDPIEPDSPRHYDLLMKGNLATYSQQHHEYTLEVMQERLRSDHELPLENGVYLEFLGNALGKDLYLLDDYQEDVVITGNQQLLQKGRPSIVLLRVARDEVNLIGRLDERGIVRTLFKPDDDLIKTLDHRRGLISLD